jgi:hypothetical protein
MRELVNLPQSLRVGRLGKGPLSWARGQQDGADE